MNRLTRESKARLRQAQGLMGEALGPIGIAFDHETEPLFHRLYETVYEWGGKSGHLILCAIWLLEIAANAEER